MDMTVANTIRQQLGGNRFEVMMGAKNFAGDNKSLQFKIGRFSGLKVKFVKVTLQANDLYHVDFFNSNCHVIAFREDVPAEALQAVFTEVTGLDTSL